MTKIVPKSAKRVLNMFWGNFSKRFFLPSVPWRVETSKCFHKNNKFSKLQKSLNRSQKCPNVFWTCFGLIFSKKNFRSVPWRVESSKCLQKIKKVSNCQECPKSFPKVSKHVLNKFWGNFFEKIILPSVPWRVESSKCFQKNLKIFKIPKMPKILPKCPNVFWTSVGVILSKNYFAQCSMERRVFEMFLNQKIFKIP